MSRLSDILPLPQKGDSRRLLGRIWRDYIKRHTGILLIALVLMTLEGSVLGAISYLVAPMFDQVLVGKDANAMLWVGGLVFGLFAMRAIAGFTQRLLVVRTGLRVVTDMQKDLMGHLLSLDSSFFQDNPPGALIERVRGDAQALQGTASSALTSVGRDLVSLISLLGVALWIDWRWAMIAFIGVPLLALPMAGLQGWIRKTTRAARAASARISLRLDEVFHGIHAIKINTLESHQQDRFTHEVDGFLAQQIRAETGQAALPATVDIIAATGFLGVLIYGGGEIIAGEKSLGEFMSFFTAMALVFDPLRRLSSISGQIQTALASLERLYGLFDARPTILDTGKIIPAPAEARKANIVFENVLFSYGDQPVLRGLSFTAFAGQTTAIVGPSGAGKSTLFHLLTRLIEPQSGDISIGGESVNSMELPALRGLFSVVSQDAALFDESIRYNLRLGRMEADDAAITQAADGAFITDFAAAQANGLDTEVGPRGSNLSGGQRQRVVIGRALLRDAPILLLDEPTSALDAASEAAIQKALDRLSAGRTTLVIAHRLSTIRDAAQIIVMDQGRVVDTGRHDELIARGGLYAELYRLQFREN